MHKDQQSTLIFVYNAASGLFNTMTDIAHKILSPSTYSCNLCAITYGLVTEKEEWREFIEQLEIPVEFLHRDEFELQYGATQSHYPVVLKRDGEAINVLLPPEEINCCKDIAELRQLIEVAIQ
jgi:hypothetical protein